MEVIRRKLECWPEVDSSEIGRQYGGKELHFCADVTAETATSSGQVLLPTDFKLTSQSQACFEVIAAGGGYRSKNKEEDEKKNEEKNGDS